MGAHWTIRMGPAMAQDAAGSSTSLCTGTVLPRRAAPLSPASGGYTRSEHFHQGV